MRKLLSIIIPVYNSEKYIYDCISSIFRQGLQEDLFEIILVNDGTQDNSIGVLSDLIMQHNNITVLNQDNQGVSVARNYGLTKAVGEYIYFMDADDLLVNNSLVTLIQKTIDSSVDILMANYIKFEDGNLRTEMISPCQHYSFEEKSADKAYIEDLSPYECYIWRMIIRRKFLIDNSIVFKPFWYEDTLFCQECFLKAKTFMKTSWQLYLYRMHPGSFTSSMTVQKMLDLNSALSSLLKLKDLVELPAVCRTRLMDNVFISFNYGLWCIVHNNCLYNDRNIIVSDLKQKIPPSKFIFTGSPKQIIVSYAFRFVPFFYLWLRYLLNKAVF